jgi:hypothetical protein
MSLQLCEKIASQCTGKEIRLFMSGEPLLHPDIGEMIKTCKKYSDKVVMHTNATMLNEYKSKEIIESGLTQLSISFDGITKEEYESTRVGANFDYVSDNIKNFIKLNNGKVNVSLQRIIKAGQEKIPLKSLFPGANHYPVIVRHSWDVKDKIEGHRPTTVYEPNCFFLWNYLPVLWNGEVCLCCADLNGRCIIGDANINSLLDIWNNEKMKSIRSRMINRKPIPEICCTCERYNI